MFKAHRRLRGLFNNVLKTRSVAYAHETEAGDIKILISIPSRASNHAGH